jgi:ribose transport system permease protein
MLRQIKMIRLNPVKILEKVGRYEQIALLFSLVILCVVSSFLSPVFLSVNNLMNVLRTASLTAICAMGMMIVVLIGELDLSVGSSQAFIGIVSVYALNSTGNIPLTILIVIIAGVCIGLINAVLVVQAGINSLIATLGTMAIIRGASYVSTGGISIQAKVSGFEKLGTGHLGPFPVPLIIAVVLFSLLWYVLKNTVFGRNIYAVGDNASAAELCGISVKKMTLIVYIIAGVTTATSSMLLASRLNSAQPNAGLGFEFQVISAVVLGGVSMSGGKGSVSGVMLGVLILSVLQNMLILVGVSSFYQEIARGLVIPLAVYIDTRNKSMTDKRALAYAEKATNEDN